MRKPVFSGRWRRRITRASHHGNWTEEMTRTHEGLNITRIPGVCLTGLFPAMPLRAIILILACLLQAAGGQAAFRDCAVEHGASSCAKACCAGHEQASCCCTRSELPETNPVTPASSTSSGRELPTPAFCVIDHPVFGAFNADLITGAAWQIAGHNVRVNRGDVPLTVLYCSFVN